MKRILLSLVLLLAVSALAAEPVEGLWLGTLDAGAMRLRLALRIGHDDKGLTGTLDSLDQGTGEMALSDVTFADGTLRFALPQLKGAYEAKLEGNALKGTWSQSGASLPLAFERATEIPKAKRPQVPKRPFPYREEEVTIANAKAGVTLAGTLTLPRSKGRFPAVVLISGSGPQDRDETIFEHRPFLLLSDHLTRRGIAVLRFDDRGFGKSTGDFNSATTEDFAGDAAACLEFLKSRKEIDPKRIGLVGHSEGGLIAPLLATRSKDVAFLVLLAGPGLPGDEILNLQQEALMRAMGIAPEQVVTVGALQRKITAAAKASKDEAELRAKLREIFGQDLPQVDASPMLSPWYRWFLSYDPRPALRKVAVPMLVLNGGKDVQITKENLAAIREAAPKATVVEFPGLNHLFQTATTGSVTEYGTIEETMAPEVLKTIGDWIAKVSAELVQ